MYWRDEQEEEERARKRGGVGEGKQKERRERDVETERIRDPVGGGMKGWRWRDKHGNKKKRRQITPVCTCKGEAFLLFLPCLFVLTVSFSSSRP